MASIDADAILCYVIGRMEIKLTEAKKTAKNGNFSEQEQIILKLKEVRKHLYTVEQNNLILLKEAKRVLSESGDIELREMVLNKKMLSLSQEIETLKKNIEL